MKEFMEILAQQFLENEFAALGDVLYRLIPAEVFAITENGERIKSGVTAWVDWQIEDNGDFWFEDLTDFVEYVYYQATIEMYIGYTPEEIQEIIDGKDPKYTHYHNDFYKIPYCEDVTITKYYK